MGQADYDGAITNARSLVEAVLAAIEKECEANPPAYDGDLPKLYKRVQKHLNLSPENPGINNSLKQTLTGFISIICGLSGLSNKMGDRHVREYKPAEHHAALFGVVFSALAVVRQHLHRWRVLRSSDEPAKRKFPSSERGDEFRQ